MTIICLEIDCSLVRNKLEVFRGQIIVSFWNIQRLALPIWQDLVEDLLDLVYQLNNDEFCGLKTETEISLATDSLFIK